MELQSALADFLIAKRADGISASTIRWYSSLLSDFAEALAGRELATITPRELREYILAIGDRTERYTEATQRPPIEGGLSDVSVNGHKRALRVFWSWCAREYGIADPARNIKVRQGCGPQRPKALSIDDFIKLIRATPDNVVGKRDRAILLFLADTGCRLGGLVGLRLDDLDLDLLTATVSEKGGRTRKVHFTELTRDILRGWLDVRGSVSDTVFTSVSTGRALTGYGVEQMLRRLKAKAGVARANPHSFRHAFAIEYLMNGGDELTLAKLLGHSSVQTTYQFYTQFTPSEMASFHARYSPVNQVLELAIQEV